MNEIFFSIVIPTYEAKGYGVSLLTELLDTIKEQTFKNFEIIVTDHSLDEEIEKCTSLWRNILDIHYYRNTTGYGNSSINMNNGIKLSKGKYIKIMHIDDKFNDNTSLEKIYNNINESENDIVWGVVGFNHFYHNQNKIDNFIIPRMTFNHLIGQSAINGCPSICFFKNGHNIIFDENLIIINDFDLYFNLNKKFGSPKIIEHFLVTIRVHENQVTQVLSDYITKEKNEIIYFKNKIYENNN